MEDRIVEFIIYFIITVTTAWFCLYVFQDRLRVSLRRLALYAILLGCAAGSVKLLFAMPIFEGLDSELTVLLLLAVAGYFGLSASVREHKSRIAFILLLAVQVQSVCESVTFLFYDIWFPELLTSNTYVLADLLGFCLPLLLLTPLFALFTRRLYLKLRLAGEGGYARLWVIPLLFVLLYSVQIFIYPVAENTFALGAKIMIILCAFITYSQMIAAIVSASKAAKEAEQHAQLAHQLELQRARVEDMESYMEELKRIRHDRRQHAAVLRGLLEKGEAGEALHYLADYETGMEMAMSPHLCENVVADALCRRYEALATQSGIEVDMKLSLPREPGVMGSDLAVILGNLWENALAAALDANGKHRFIRLLAGMQDGKLLIRMENGHGGNICREAGRFLSTKPERNNAEGVGIASVRAAAERYGGVADFSYTSDTFTALVLLYTNIP